MYHLKLCEVIRCKEMPENELNQINNQTSYLNRLLEDRSTPKITLDLESITLTRMILRYRFQAGVIPAEIIAANETLSRVQTILNDNIYTLLED